MSFCGTDYPEPEPVDPFDDAPHDVDDEPTGPTVVRLADVTPEHVEWLWPGYLPTAKLVTLDGDPGLGKSTLALDWAARVTTGECWPDGEPCPTGDVLLLSAEDGLADTIRPRLDAAGADTTRVHALTEVHYLDDGKRHTRPPVLPQDVPLVEGIVRRHGVRLVIVDVLMAYLDGGVNAHRDQDVRRALAPLSRLADTTGATVLVLRHLNKATGGPAIYRGGGSIGIVGAARVGLVTVLDPDDDTEARRILAVAKNNLSAKPPARMFTLAADPGRDVARVNWLGTDSRGVDELLAHRADPEERTERDELVERIRDYLNERGGQAPAGVILKALRGEGYPERTVKRARLRSGVESVKDGMRGPWLWRLTSAERATATPEGAEGAKPSDPGIFDPFVAASSHNGDHPPARARSASGHFTPAS